MKPQLTLPGCQERRCRESGGKILPPVDRQATSILSDKYSYDYILSMNKMG